MPASDVLPSMTDVWIRFWTVRREGLPGRSRKDLAAVNKVRRMFQADDSVYISLITANMSSTATRVSLSASCEYCRLGFGCPRLPATDGGGVRTCWEPLRKCFGDAMLSLILPAMSPPLVGEP